jgi:hypothetical protein
MLVMIAMLIKLLVGGVISYVLPSVTVKNIKQTDHLRITFMGILTTSLFSVTYQMDAGSPYVLSTGALIFIGILCKAQGNEIQSTERILFYSLVVIGLFIGFGYIFQGIILSFLVYYITINKSDLFSILVENEEDQKDDSTNNKIM